MKSSAGVSQIDSDALYKKVSWRLLPILLLAYVIAYLDRVNVGFAKLHMLGELGLSELAYGLGAGIFFIGYFLFEVPSNILLHRVGARIWISRIMFSWGLVSIATAFVKTEAHFYLLRFLLGVAEAGFFPGIILYLTYWYPAQRRGRVTSLFMSGVSIAGVIGGPLSGWILDRFHAHQGWSGWQWLFVLEGIPSLILGVIVFFYLEDKIRDAKWLTAEERSYLQNQIEAEESAKTHLPTFDALKNRRVWYLSGIYFCFVMGVYGIGFWLPTIVKSLGTQDDLQVGLITAIPWGAAAVAMIWIGSRSDRTGAYRLYAAIPALLGALGLILSVVWAAQPVLALMALTLATMGIFSCLPVFWSLPTSFLVGTGAAAGIALVNSLGNLAGFVSPYAVGWLKTVTQKTDAGMYLLAFFLVLGALATLALREDSLRHGQGQRAP
jgi:D-galactonate transporter